MFAPLIAALFMMQAIDDTGTAIAQPIGTAILEPTSGAYFQVFEFYGRPPHTWRHAKRMVKGYLHEGREGRLAQIKNSNIHYFLILNFDDLRKFPMWIGLSADCNEQADLMWVDGTPLSETSFRGWNPVAQKKIRDTCKGLQDTGTQLPIYYEPDQLAARWEMATPNRNITRMMVEFPVPEEEEAASEASSSGQ